MILVLLVLVAVLALVIFAFLRAKHMKHKMILVAIIFVVVILGIGYFAAIAGKDINLNTVDGMATAGKLYVGWLVNGFDNMKVLTGNVVSMNWRNTEANITAPTFTKIDSNGIAQNTPAKR